MPLSPCALAPSFVAAVLLGACGGGNVASQLAKAPDFAPKDQTKCGVTKSQAKPLIVEWPSADRGELEAQAHNRGVVVVRYQGCEMQVLDRCTTSVRYSYSSITRKKDRVTMRDADDLYANVPIGAAKLESKLERSGELDVDMTMVGRWEADRASVRVDELQGSCDGATHVVSALTVGAFTFTAGADATVGGSATVMGAGGSAQSTSKRETLNADGDESACQKSTAADKAPPDGCGALLRVEVAPLGETKALTTTCPDGTQWNGSACLASAPSPAPAVSATGGVSDATRAAARELVQAGYELQQQQRYAEALDKFTRAQALFSAPTILIHIAECQAQLGMLVEARGTYRALAAMRLPPDTPASFSAAQAKGATELLELEQRMAQHR